MANFKREFHRHEKGMGNETWHYLARDAESGRVFVIKETSTRSGGSMSEFVGGNEEIELADFLGGYGSSARNNLIELIGTLVPEPDDG